MTEPRWRRLLPDRSQLWILLVALVVVGGGASFVNLLAARNTALAEYKAAEKQVQGLEQQRDALQAAKVQSEDGGEIPLLAREYYGYGFKGETKIITVPEPGSTPVPPGQAPEGGPPYWSDWLQRLIRP